MIRQKLIIPLCLLVCCGVLCADQPNKPGLAQVQAKPFPVQLIRGMPIPAQLQKQRETSNRYTEAIAELQEAKKKLATAEAQQQEAKTEQAKTEAEQQVKQAKAKVQEAEAAIAEARRAVALQSRKLSSIVGRARQQVNRQDDEERFALLLPGGPIVIQVKMQLNNEPFRTQREAMVDQMLRDADTDMDGRPTWQEALRSPRFTYGRLHISNPEQEKLQIAIFDLDENGIVSHGEARQFLAHFFRGPVFDINNTSQTPATRSPFTIVNGRRVPRTAKVDVTRLLDQDKDGSLSKDEIAAAGDFLKSRDVDDDDLLYLHELAANPARPVNTLSYNMNSSTRQQTGVLLGPTVDADKIFLALQANYSASSEAQGETNAKAITAKNFSSVPKLFAKLDANQNGELDQDEVLTLNTVQPHLTLLVNLQNEDKPKQSVKITALSDSLATVKDSDGNADHKIIVSAEGARIHLNVNMTKARKTDYSNTAKSYMTRFDKDKNGHLDKRELTGNYARMMAMWDANTDGKVFPQEIIDSYTRMRAPAKTQIRSYVANQGNSLFQALDQSGDQRLSLREMRTANKQIIAFDENQDGRVSNREVPIAVAVTFGVSDVGYGSTVIRGRTPEKQKSTPRENAPDWFTRMDRNGDGDLTLREFLGSESDFQALDTNHDGFIEANEAAAVAPTTTNEP